MRNAMTAHAASSNEKRSPLRHHCKSMFAKSVPWLHRQSSLYSKIPMVVDFAGRMPVRHESPTHYSYSAPFFLGRKNRSEISGGTRTYKKRQSHKLTWRLIHGGGIFFGGVFSDG
jgi:hypothetical protein